MSGTLAHQPAAIIRQLLIDLGHGTIPSDGGAWPIAVGHMPDSPDSAIRVVDTTGRDFGREMIAGERAEHPGVQIMVRDADEAGGWAKAHAIAIGLDKDVAYAGVTIGAVGYTVYAVTRSSGPIALGKEPGTKRDLFTINATVSLRQS